MGESASLTFVLRDEGTLAPDQTPRAGTAQGQNGSAPADTSAKDAARTSRDAQSQAERDTDAWLAQQAKQDAKDAKEAAKTAAADIADEMADAMLWAKQQIKEHRQTVEEGVAGVKEDEKAQADTKDRVKAVGGIASSAAQASAAAATGNVGGAVKGAASAASGLLGMIPGGAVAAVAVGMAVNTAVDIINQFVGAIKSADAALLAMADKVSAYSGAAAAAQAQNEVAKMRADMRSAQTLGADLARYTTARTRMDVAMQRIMDIIEKWGLERLTPIVEGLAVLMENNSGLIAGSIIGLGGALVPGLSIIANAASILGANAQTAAIENKGDLMQLFQNYPDVELDNYEASGDEIRGANIGGAPA